MSPWWLKPPADDDSVGSEGREDPREKNKENKENDQPGLDLDPTSLLVAALPDEPGSAGDTGGSDASNEGAGSAGSDSPGAEEPAAEKVKSSGRPSRRRGSRSRGSSKSRAKSSEAEADETKDKDEAKAPARKRTASRSSAKKAAKPAAKAPAKSAAKAPTKSEGRPARRKKAVPREVARDESDDFVGSPVYVAVQESGRPLADERRMALFCDLENIALGVRDSEISKFALNLVLERLLEKGKIIVKRAYADWERYKEFKRSFHEAGVEMIDIPQKHYSGKNSADIKMVVDAMELCWAKEHLDTFVLLSGDSDFTPLVGKLKENNKHVIGIGVKNSSSRLLIDNCDEFIFYEDVWRDDQKGPALDGVSEKSAEVFGLLVDAVKALMRENKDVLWGSMVKQTMQRKRPSFNEGYFGYSSFSDLLTDAEAQGILELKRDQRSGSYIIKGL